jgi:hypothetical protein
MTPLGLGTGFYGLGPTINSDNAAVIVTPTGTAVRVKTGPYQGVKTLVENLQSTFRGSFTIAFWIKVVDGQPHTDQIFCGSLGGGASNSAVFLQLRTDGKLHFGFVAGGDQHLNGTNAAVFADGANAYKHIAVTMTIVSDDDSVSVIYVDGAPVATSIIGGDEVTEAKHETWTDNLGNEIFGIGTMGMMYGAQPGTAGSGVTDTGLGTEADIAEFAIWNVALSDAAVAAVEDLGVPTASNFPDLTASSGSYTAQGNLVTYHKLNDYSGGFAAEQIVGFDSHTGVLLGHSVFV